jgi:hypothetical protein
MVGECTSIVWANNDKLEKVFGEVRNLGYEKTFKE